MKNANAFVSPANTQPKETWAKPELNVLDVKIDTLGAATTPSSDSSTNFS